MSAEHFFFKGPNGFRLQLIFIGIDQKIGFQEDLVIHPVDTAVGMVMGDEEGDPIDEIFGGSQLFEDGPCRCRPFDFLEMAG